MSRGFKEINSWDVTGRRLAATAVLLLTSSWALAGGPTLATNPTVPSSQQSFEVVYTLDGCGDTFPSYGSNNRTVEVDGNVVRITVAYAEQACFDGQPYVPAYDWRVGPLPAGTYDLVLQGYSLNGDPADTFELAATTVVIAPGLTIASPSVIPTTSVLGDAALTVLMLAIAALVTAKGRTH